jgi:hypothetical protein
MAFETTWQGNTIVFDAAVNWDNGIPGTTAADGAAIFDGRISQRSPQSNMDQSGAAWPFQVITRPDFLAGIGSPGNPLKYKGIATSRAAMIRGPGATYLESADGGAQFPDAVIDSNAGIVHLDGAWFGVLVKSGNVTVLPTGDILDTCVIDGYTAVLTVLEEAAAEKLGTEFTLHDGRVNIARNWPAVAAVLSVHSGELTQTGTIASQVKYIQGGGYVIYDPLASPAALQPDAHVMGGVFDISKHRGTIPFARFIKGRNATVIGSPTSAGPSFTDYDLADDTPGS